MSLDVHLRAEEKFKKPESSGIFIRENGHTVEISEAEWYRRYPDREPVKYHSSETETDELYHANITHNLGQMASHAGLYNALWQPEQQDWTIAADIIPALKAGLTELKARPSEFREYNPDNGWGTYEQFVSFVEAYLAACRRYPNATIEVSR